MRCGHSFQSTPVIATVGAMADVLNIIGLNLQTLSITQTDPVRHTSSYFINVNFISSCLKDLDKTYMSHSLYDPSSSENLEVPNL